MLLSSSSIRNVTRAPACSSDSTRPSRLYLIGSLEPENFADLFDQTITYGLFAARIRARNGFNGRVAFDNIPHTIGVLRDLFRFISLGDLPEPLAWFVDDIAEVMAVADALGILERYYQKGQGNDPIVHFYQTFLKQYDPDERERRGGLLYARTGGRLHCSFPARSPQD